MVVHQFVDFLAMLRFVGGNKRLLLHVAALMIICVVSAFFIFGGGDVFAQSDLSSSELGATQFEASGLTGGGGLTLIIARIIRALFGLLGVAAVGWFVYGGVLWMTAGGDETKVGKAKQAMINATIGMAIMLMSFVIASFIISALLGAIDTGGGGGKGSAAVPTPGGFMGGGMLGKSIEYVLPEPYAKGVYRNTAVVVQFKHQVVPDTIFASINPEDPEKPGKVTGEIDASAIMIYQKSLGEPSALPASDLIGSLAETTVSLNGIEKKRSLLTVMLKPGELLGSAQTDTDYEVKLSPSIKRYNDAGNEIALFASINGYVWEFEVGTEVDLTPPKITSVYPSVNSEGNYRNVTLMINFNKSMMPSTILEGNYISVSDVDSSAIEGVWSISNMARTAEFRTNVECGESACGDPYYCFDPNITVEVVAEPSPIDTDFGAPKSVIPFAGLVSLTGNSMDGDGDGEAEGPAVFEDDGTVDMRDTVGWQFGVGADIDVIGPVIEDYEPKANTGSVSQVAPIHVRYNEALLPSTISYAFLNQPTDFDQWYYPSSTALDASNQEITDPEITIEKNEY